MTYYIFLENNKLNGCGQCKILNENIQNIEVTEDVYNFYNTNPEKYIYSEGEIIENPNYALKQADLKRTYLKEQVNYPLKAQYAYTGVKFDYNINNENIEVVFQTDKDSIIMINSFLVKILSCTLTKVENWKCRRSIEPFEPVSVNFTVEQFQNIVNFADIMVQQAFLVESKINEQIDELTTEQLNDEQFISEFKINIKNNYKIINTKIENLFE